MELQSVGDYSTAAELRVTQQLGGRVVEGCGSGSSCDCEASKAQRGMTPK